ncbi:MAG TPA: alpha-ketoglutarate-dependent dioxygenase AlkB [Nitrososphaeraceae archaeon]
MALDSESAVHILLEGSPSSAKTMFLTSLMHRIKNSYFANGGSSSKAGMIDYLLTNKSRISVVLEHGSLLVMKNATQSNWLHSLPKSKNITQPRINLTFRSIRES